MNHYIRELCSKLNIPIVFKNRKGKESPYYTNALFDKLAKKDILNQSDKNIFERCKKIRNFADHGYPERFSDDDAGNVISDLIKLDLKIQMKTYIKSE